MSETPKTLWCTVACFDMFPEDHPVCEQPKEEPRLDNRWRLMKADILGARNTGDGVQYLLSDGAVVDNIWCTLGVSCWEDLTEASKALLQQRVKEVPWECCINEDLIQAITDKSGELDGSWGNCEDFGEWAMRVSNQTAFILSHVHRDIVNIILQHRRLLRQEAANAD